MATLYMGASSSHCAKCYGNAPSSAAPNEAGHFTVIGFDKEARDKGGCGERWDAVVSTYVVADRADFIRRVKEFYPTLAKIPDENWTVPAYGEFPQRSASQAASV